jgi:xanthosine utilization system XapX-like protein
VWVAGTDENTSIAFGYAAESYLDFGVPLMFLPSLVFGLAMGVLHATLMRQLRHRDIAIPLVTVIFWLGLYLFERSWIKTLGMTLTMTVYLGGVGYLIDQYLTGREQKMLAPPDEAAVAGGHSSR